MKKLPPAFTLLELLVVIAIIGILASVALPAINTALKKGQILQTVSNYHQLYTVTESASLDNQADETTNAGFPADVGGTAATWQAALISNNYLSESTFSNFFNVQGLTNSTAVYIVSYKSSNTDVFLSTMNFSNNTYITNVSPYKAVGAALVTAGGSALLILGSNYNTNTFQFSTN